MIPAIYDDRAHVLQACRMGEILPDYRPFVYWLTCKTGESLEVTRWLALGFLLASVWLFLRTKLKSPQASWLLFLHPLYLFPFFYPSQISTAISIFWAALAWTAISYEGALALKVGALAGLVGLGAWLRAETLYFLWIFVGAFFLLQGPAFGRWNPARVLGKKPLTWLTVFSFAVFWFSRAREIAVWVTGTPARLLTASTSLDATGDYPLSSHLPVQIYAQFLYLKNLLFPIGFSFYGPWADWWKIHSSLSLQRGLLVGFLLTAGVLGIATFRAKAGSFGRILGLGTLVFLGTCSVSSLAPRGDWYFASRQILGTLLFSLFLYSAFTQTEASRAKTVLSRVVGAYLLISLIGWIGFKYRNLETFLADEEAKVGQTSPLVHMERVNFYLQAKDPVPALRAVYRAYQAIPSESLPSSKTARTLWVNALAKGYELSETIGDHASALSAARTLFRSESYLSTKVCLKSHIFPDEKCLEGNRGKIYEQFLQDEKAGKYLE